VRYFHLAVLAVVLSFLLTGCASRKNEDGAAQAASNAPRPAEHTIKLIKTVVMNKSLELVKSEEYGQSLLVSLRPIPGSLAGMPVMTNSLLIQARLGDDFRLSMAELERTVGPSAESADAGMLASGVVVSPSDTRFLRVGTFFQESPSPNALLGAGFIDAARRENVTLAYFDRACSLVGDVHIDDRVISFALKIPGAGLYWMGTDRSDPVHWHAKLVDPNATLWYALIR
jgi:hypothetical protein